MDVLTCPNGHENPSGQKFCGECGAQIETTDEATASQSVEAPNPSSQAETWATSTTKGKRNPLILVGAGVAVVIIALLGWLVLSSRGGTTGPLAEKHTIKGSLTASECGGGFDIENASVEIRDEKDKLIGSGSTGFDVSSGSGCKVEFTIPDVPKATFYQVTIGTHGGPSYSYQDMKSANWTIDLSLS